MIGGCVEDQERRVVKNADMQQTRVDLDEELHYQYR